MRKTCADSPAADETTEVADQQSLQWLDYPNEGEEPTTALIIAQLLADVTDPFDRFKEWLQRTCKFNVVLRQTKRTPDGTVFYAGYRCTNCREQFASLRELPDCLRVVLCSHNCEK